MKKRTSTEIIFSAMSEFSTSEPTALMVLFVDEAGDVCLITNASNTQGLGLCEYGKQSIINRIFAKDTE